MDRTLPAILMLCHVAVARTEYRTRFPRYSTGVGYESIAAITCSWPLFTELLPSNGCYRCLLSGRYLAMGLYVTILSIIHYYGDEITYNKVGRIINMYIRDKESDLSFSQEP
jgi:hypothetical protein